jgi:hypothetical protein
MIELISNIFLYKAIYLLMRKFKKNEKIVSKIYLLDGGSSTEIHYANSLKRKLFG